ncbi:MAG: L-threonylcarbamoyladenylate synthase [Chloroflexota bacterium]
MPKTVVIDALSPDPQVIKQAAGLIVQGRVLVCPTDTGYAFAASAVDTRAVARVFELKGRAYSNPIHVAVNSVEEARKYAQVNKAAEQLARHFLPGALTMVLPRKETIPPLLVSGRDTVGIRIPDNRAMLELAALTGRPITATSANISGQPTPYDVEEIRKQMGKAIRGVALILDQGTLPSRELSTIVDLTVSPPRLIRQGRVSWLEIRQVLQSL